MKPQKFVCLLAFALFAGIPVALASTIWYVDGVNGSDSNDCKSRVTACRTIGHAISLASSGDSVMVAATTYTENLSIGISLRLLGAGAKTTIIDGGGVNTVVTISSASAHVSLSKVTIRNGFAMSGGGIYNSGTLGVTASTLSGNRANGSLQVTGGGIYNNGTLTITTSTLSGNSAFTSGHGFSSARGGGIYNLGTVTINNSTLSVNFAQGSISVSGGGIHNFGTLTINNSTLSGNSAQGDTGVSGGGIDNDGGTLTISNSTLSANWSGSGGGVSNSGTAALQNSIIANSPAGGNCSGALVSNGYNLSSDNTCNFNNSGDLNNTDPKLGPLQNNGGPTQTQALLPGSPAIDAGNPSGCTDSLGHLLKTDQRGRPRPDKEDSGGCDMGAYEKQSD